MGWSFSTLDIGRKAHIEEITSQKHFSENYKPLAHRVVGNNVWQVVEHLPTGRRLIALDMIAKDRNGGWGYKGMSEDAWPTAVNCPLSLLAMASEPPAGSYAAAWREKVREYHQAIKKRPELVPGLRVAMADGTVLELVRKYSTRSWVVRSSSGTLYRATSTRLRTLAPQN